MIEKNKETQKILVVQDSAFKVVDCLQQAFTPEVVLTAIGANGKEYVARAEFSHLDSNQEVETFYYTLIGSSLRSAFIG